MKQPLVLTPMRIPPAQAEALYDTSPEERGRTSPSDAVAWPGEDWEDDALSAYRPFTTPDTGKSRAAQH